MGLSGGNVKKLRWLMVKLFPFSYCKFLWLVQFPMLLFILYSCKSVHDDRPKRNFQHQKLYFEVPLTWIIDFHDACLWESHLHVTHHSVWPAFRQRRGCFLKEYFVILNTNMYFCSMTLINYHKWESFVTTC